MFYEIGQKVFGSTKVTNCSVKQPNHFNTFDRMLNKNNTNYK